jgi:hypothetical protein
MRISLNPVVYHVSTTPLGLSGVQAIKTTSKPMTAGGALALTRPSLPNLEEGPNQRSTLPRIAAFSNYPST